MGRSTRSVPRERMSQEKLDALIQKPVVLEREPVEPRPILTDTIAYDTMHPDEIIQNFSAAVRNMLARYQYDKEEYSRAEQEMQDILHYIEMSTDKNANVGFKLYKQLAEVRRRRRVCKNEMDLLQPIYDSFSGGEKLNALAQILGTVRAAKQTINSRAYTLRTDILETFIKGRD